MESLKKHFQRVTGRFQAVGEEVKSRYKRFERFQPIVFFAAGFLWDSLTLKRIDRLVDNMVLLAYLLLLGALIVITNMAASGKMRSRFVLRFAKWYPMGIQFFLGGLFSGYVVFYFKSASMTRTSLFLVLLTLLMVANEFLHDRLVNFTLQSSLFYLVGHSFLIFFIPVVLKTMGYGVFVLGGLVSLAATGGIMYFLWRKGAVMSRWRLTQAGIIVVCLFVILNIFYLLNWIPPVPLSLKAGGIYRNVTRVDGTYQLSYAKPPWYLFLRRGEPVFRRTKEDSVYCFTAIFAPTELKKKIYHHWQLLDPKEDEWVETDRVGFEITGGSDIGWRGYTAKHNMTPGQWRVQVKTDDGLLLGEVSFEVEATDKEPKKIKTITY
jgi:hypothetical protein